MKAKKGQSPAFRPSRVLYALFGVTVGYFMQAITPPLQGSTAWVVQFTNSQHARMAITVLTSSEKGVALDIPEPDVVGVRVPHSCLTNSRASVRSVSRPTHRRRACQLD
jgi:hypothetical protein